MFYSSTDFYETLEQKKNLFFNRFVKMLKRKEKML